MQRWGPERERRERRLERCREVLDLLESLHGELERERDLAVAERRVVAQLAQERPRDSALIREVTGGIVAALRSALVGGARISSPRALLDPAAEQLAKQVPFESVAEELAGRGGLDEDVAYLMAEQLAEALRVDPDR